MKVRSLHLTLLLILLLFLEFSAIAQMSSAQQFAEKQFYGNRIRSGSVLLSGTFQRSNFADSDRDGLTGRVGLGAGVGLSENIAFVMAYNRERTYRALGDPFFGLIEEYRTDQTINLGVRFLPNTLGGFIQPYVGLDFLWERRDFRRDIGEDPLAKSTFIGGQIPIGFIIWISTFMSVSLEPFNFSLIGETSGDTSWEGVYDIDLNLANPRFGLNFIISAKKP